MTSLAFLHLVWTAAQTVFCMSIILVLMTGWLRLVERYRATRRIADFYGPIFANPSAHLLSPPTLHARGALAALALWHEAYETASTNDRRYLEELGHAIGFDAVALRHLHDDRLDTRILCVTTIGRLALVQAWDLIQDLPRHPNARLSFAAIRSLFALDANRAVTYYVIQLLRTDWSPTKVAECLQEVDETRLATVFVRLLRLTRSNIQAIQLLRYLGATRCVPALDGIRHYLDSAPRHPRVLAEGLHALSYFRSVEDLPRYRHALTATHWYLRVRGAIGLGHVGTVDDLSLLTPLLGDSSWWVRYRAAEAITRLRGVSTQALQSLMITERDPFGRNALKAFSTTATGASRTDSYYSLSSPEE